MQLDCQLFIDSNCAHLQQIYTGFSELGRKRLVTLKLMKSERLNNAALLKVVVNNKHKVIYDTSDGFNFYGSRGLDENLLHLSRVLEGVDFYFKRSYSATVISSLKDNYKVYPLGLSYYVSSESNFGEAISINLGGRLKRLLRQSALLSKLLGIAHAPLLHFEQFEYFPCVSNNLKILFMARAWDPKDCRWCKPQDIELINNMRAECIRRCRKEFGAFFLGGLAVDEYTKKNFSDILLPDSKESRKLEYLKRVKESDICVATTGLHNSIGWKLGEYVAASKAIVSEKLHYELPGEFTPRHNYLEFTTPEECVQDIYELINDKSLRLRLMLNNYRYYHTYVRPDILVMNTLLKVLERG